MLTSVLQPLQHPTPEVSQALYEWQLVYSVALETHVSPFPWKRLKEVEQDSDGI